MFLPKTYFPKHSENRMENADNVAMARELFLSHTPSNLCYLLGNRYGWMNKYINGKENVIEIGAGAGLSKEFIDNKKLRLTDYDASNVWIDEQVDALNMPYDDNSMDAIVSSDVIHHLANPTRYLKEATRVLKPGGLLVILDTYTSLLHRMALRMMRHDGWSYEVDVFDEKVLANNPDDPWSANAAVPQLLFNNHKKFHQYFPELEIVMHELCECFIYLISGGIIAKVPTINLPRPVLAVIDKVDNLLIKMFPSVFALSIKVVLRKKARLRNASHARKAEQVS